MRPVQSPDGFDTRTDFVISDSVLASKGLGHSAGEANLKIRNPISTDVGAVPGLLELGGVLVEFFHLLLPRPRDWADGVTPVDATDVLK